MVGIVVDTGPDEEGSDGVVDEGVAMAGEKEVRTSGE